VSLDEAVISAVMASAFNPCLYCVPVHDTEGKIHDFEIENLNSQAAEWLGISNEVTGPLRLRRDFPEHIPDSIWMIYQHVMDSGEHKEWTYNLSDNPDLAAYEVKLVRLQQGLLLSFRPEEHPTPGQTLEQQLQKILAEEAAEGMLDWDLKSGVARYSQRLKVMLGFGRIAIPQIIQIFFNALSPAEAEPVQNLIWNAINGDESTVEHRTRFMHQDGSLITLWCSGRILRNAEGEALRVVYVFRDETLEAQLKEDLQHQQELLQLFVDASQDGFFEWNPTNDTIYFSSRWKQMLGYVHMDNDWKSWKLFLPDAQTTWLSELKDSIQAGVLPESPVLLKLNHREGHQVSIILRLSGKQLPGGDHPGRFIRILGLGTDLSILDQESP